MSILLTGLLVCLSQSPALPFTGFHPDTLRHRSVVDYNLPIHLNAFFRVVETLTIICVLGLRQVSGDCLQFSSSHR